LCENTHEFKEVLFKGVFFDHHNETEFVLEMKLMAIVGDFEVNLGATPFLLLGFAFRMNHNPSFLVARVIMHF
jgi:hypothetical protein